jgi:hypothetical protein
MSPLTCAMTLAAPASEYIHVVGVGRLVYLTPHSGEFLFMLFTTYFQSTAFLREVSYNDTVS